MLHPTRGIALHALKYSESSLIVRIYTEQFGLQSYMVKGARRPKSKFRPGYFQPLTLLDLIVYHKEKSNLQQIKEVKLAASGQEISSSIPKSAIALFCSELILRAIEEEEPNPSLFAFLWSSFELLIDTRNPLANFPLMFVVQFSRHLGFYPQGPDKTKKERFFQLREGHFTSLYDHPSESLDAVQSQYLLHLLDKPFNQFALVSIPSDTRKSLLEKLILYYRIHLPGMKGIRSHEVLHTVLS
jgi:DNA repair protein RecO (recombination protein O)